MRDAPARSVATHYATCTAFSLSAIAAPFVPEAIALYAGIRYLTAFLYGPRQWRGPGRIPLHLGKRGYRDESTRKRGAATWPIGTAGDQQVWLLREDLAQGCAFIGDDPAWHADAISQLVFGACLNQTGALVVQDHAGPTLAKRIADIARPFGRDLEMARIDLHDPHSEPLRITTQAIEDTLVGLGLSEAGLALNAALAPALNLVATRYRRNSLPLYRAILDKDALDKLLVGRPAIEGIVTSAASEPGTESIIPPQLLGRLKAITPADLEQGRQDLAPHARELADTPGLSLTHGLALDGALATGRLVCLRPSTPLNAALTAVLSTHALAASDPDSATTTLVHLADPALPRDMAKNFLVSATQAGAVASIALPSTPEDEAKFATQLCHLRFERSNQDGKSLTAATSTIKGCAFALELQPVLVNPQKATEPQYDRA